MQSLPTPTRTPLAHQWLARPEARLDLAQWALLASVDGRRNIVELESFARAVGLASTAVETLRARGLIDLGSEPVGR
jgi:hypothetical protein